MKVLSLAPDELKDLQRMLEQCRRRLLAAAKNQGRRDLLTDALEQYSRLLGQFEPLTKGNVHEFKNRANMPLSC